MLIQPAGNAAISDTAGEGARTMPWHRHHGEIQGVDPHCVAYKRIFDEITDRLNKEMFESPMMEMAPFPQKTRKAAKPGVMALMHKVFRSKKIRIYMSTFFFIFSYSQTLRDMAQVRFLIPNSAFDAKHYRIRIIAMHSLLRITVTAKDLRDCNESSTQLFFR